MTAPPSLLNLDDEIREFQKDIGLLQDRLVQIRQLESNLWNQQSSLSSDIIKRQKHLDIILKEASNSHNSKITQACKDQRLQGELDSIIKSRPIKIPILLWASLGTANYYLPDRHRLRYKQEYEKFKIQTVIIQLILAIIQYFWLEYTWLDAMWYFFFFYSYSSILMREHILR